MRTSRRHPGRALGWTAERFLAVADSLVRAAARAALWDPAAAAAHDTLLAGESERLPRRLRWCEGYLAPDTYSSPPEPGPATVAAILVTTQLARLDSRAGRERTAAADLAAHATADPGLDRRGRGPAGRRAAADRGGVSEPPGGGLAPGGGSDRGLHPGQEGSAPVLPGPGGGIGLEHLPATGLPPGPIGSPGVAALAAAARAGHGLRGLLLRLRWRGRPRVFADGAEHEAAVRRVPRRQRGGTATAGRLTGPAEVMVCLAGARAEVPRDDGKGMVAWRFLRRSWLLVAALAAIVSATGPGGRGLSIGPLLLVVGYCVLLPLFLWRVSASGWANSSAG